MKQIKDKIGRIKSELITTEDISISTNFDVGKLDSLSRLSILLVLAGYKQEEDITVFGKDLSYYININRFGSLNLNFKKAAPKEFDMNIKFKPGEPEKKRIYSGEGKKTIVLTSGGIDSVAGMLYCEEKGIDYVPFWLRFGQRNQRGEKESVYGVAQKLGISPLRCDVNLEEYVKKGWSAWKLGIIPARNFMIASLAGLYINNLKENEIDVFLCASKDEIVESHNDTSPEFYREASKLMSGFYNKKISICTPFKDVNKADIIKYWSKKWEGESGVAISDTMTCFLGEHCGTCSSCYYRRINGLVAGVDDVDFKEDPLHDKGGLIKEYYLKSFDNWSDTRRIDFLIALDEGRDIIPKYASTFLSENYPKYEKLIEERKKQLEAIEIK